MSSGFLRARYSNSVCVTPAVNSNSALRGGERQVAEKILADHVDFAENDEWALELIYCEFAALDELGQRPTPEELCRRFPLLRDRILRLLQVHELLDTDDFDGIGKLGRPPTVSDTSVGSGSTHDPQVVGRSQTARGRLSASDRMSCSKKSVGVRRAWSTKPGSWSWTASSR